MSAVTPRLLTAEELWRLPDNGKRRDLVRGEVMETVPPGGRTARSHCPGTGHAFTGMGEAWAGGCVGVESDFILSRDPDTVRSPDIFYVRAKRLSGTGIPEAYWEIAPDLAVEIVSPSESADDVREKVRHYLTAGTSLVWIVYPRTQEVIVHTPDGLARAYSGNDVLEVGDLLPGFTCRVAELFA
jgi:Uma2 family endonuclease